MNFSLKNISGVAITITLLVLFSFPLFSQSRSKISDRKIKSIFTSTFDVRKGDTTLKKNLSKYDHRGNVIESIDYDVQGNIKDHEQFRYNHHGDEVMYIQLSSNQKVIKKIETFYNKWYNLLQKVTYDATGIISETMEATYNASNDPVAEITRNGNGRIIRHTIYTYDNKSMLISKKIYRENNILIYSKDYSIEY
jgi:hypothetical protein